MSQFSTNILCVGLLKSQYNVLITRDPSATNKISTCIVSRRNDEKCVLAVPISDGLFAVQMSKDSVLIAKNNDVAASTSTKQKLLGSNYSKIDQPAMDWHIKLGSISAKRLFKISKICPAEPNISMGTLRNLFCPDCQNVEAKRAPIQRSNRRTIRPLELIHIDVLGLMRTKSVGGLSWSFICSRNSRRFYDLLRYFLSVYSKSRVRSALRVYHYNQTDNRSAPSINSIRRA